MPLCDTAANCTLVFSVGQALLAAKAGATYVSPFVGRLDDICEDGIALVAKIVEMYRYYGSVSYTHLDVYKRQTAIEAPFFGKNVQSMLKLGRAQGVAMAAALRLTGTKIE